MAGIVGLTEIQHTSGNSAMTITTSGDVNVKGEGTNTTNLRQGLCKAWLNYKGTSTNAINDSFNTASVTDNNTGDYTQNLTTSFSSANNSYTLSTQAEPGNPDNGMYTFLQTFTTSTFKFGARTARNSGKTDVDFIFPKIHGDLS
jgi:hypothetical protein